MISLAVMAIVMAGIYRLHAQTIDAVRQIRFYATAPYLARQKMTDVSRQPLDEIMGDAGGFEEDYPGLKWQVSVDDLQIDLFEDEPLEVKQIHVIVSRTDDERSYTLSQYRMF